MNSGSFNYNGLTLSLLEAGVAEDAQNVIDNLQPDRLVLATEPSTIAFNTGLSAIDNPSTYAGYVAAVRSALNTTNSPSTKIGAGSDNWESSSFLSSLLSSTSLDFYDMHIYPPDDLQTSISDLALLRASGHPVSISETWLDKEDVSVDGTTGPIIAQTVSVRDSYSFWANVDAQYITSLMQLARCNAAQYVMLWDANLLYAYVDFTPATAGYTYAQMVTAYMAAQAAAKAGNYVSPAGYAVMQATGRAPAALHRRPPA